ncbi:MAG: S1 family peptidase [Myxococcales bacterium]|nr:S1 family peptidase [Myxococcales bacterium]
MRRIKLLSAPMFLGLAATVAACQIDSGGFHEDDLGSAEQASTGGLPAQGQGHYDAVAAITILLPSNDNDTARTNYRYCTGVLIAERTVMTAAACLKSNLEAELDDKLTGPFLDAESIVVRFESEDRTTEYALDATFDDEAPMTVKGLTMHRYYDTQPRYDVALLSLSETPSGITPVPIRATSIGADLVGQPLELVGYGKEDGAGGDETALTARNVIAPDIVNVSDTRITAGTEELTTCFADSGGPGFVDFGDGPEVVSINERHGECDAGATRQRVDIYANEFLLPFLNYKGGGCDGGACDDCEYNGVCEEDCDTRDWDCPIGSWAGTACVQNGDCEEQGACVPASDDASFTYCDKPCDQEVSSSCPADMICSEDSRCIHTDPSPGSQGATCTSPATCRSGFCENTFCANECDASDSNACDSDNGFFCLESLDDSSTTVCRTKLRDGGGGFCHAGASPRLRNGARNSLLAGLGLLFVFGAFRRRRRG